MRRTVRLPPAPNATLQAQLAALSLKNVGFSTTIDTGDWTNIHPYDWAALDP
jgi:hypothetical protein